MHLRFSCALLVALLALAWTPAQASPGNDEHALSMLAKSKKRKKKRAKPRSKQATSGSKPASRAQPRPASPVRAPAPAVVALDIQRHSLQNGLHVVLQPDPSLPSVAVTATYRLGRAFESPGEAGFAHAVFQHLQANTNISTLPAPAVYTGPDRIAFTSLVPPSRLAHALWREAHRIARPIDNRSFQALKTTLRGLGQPTPRARAEALAYQGCWAFGHPAFGWDEDLEQSDAESLEAFRRRMLAPARSVVSISGRFDPQQALEELQRLFGPMPSVTEGKSPDLVVPDQINQRVDIEKSSQPVNQFFLYAWAVPPSGHADLAAIRLAVAMLQDGTRTGTASRSERLAKLPETATLSIELDERIGPSLLTLRVDLPATLDMDETRKIVDEAMLELAARGPSAAEMQNAWQSVQRSWLATLSSIDTRSSTLARVELLQDDATKATALSSRLVNANREQIRQAVRTYLTPIRRNLVEKRGPRVQRPSPTPPTTGSKRKQTKKGRRSGRRGSK